MSYFITIVMSFFTMYFATKFAIYCSEKFTFKDIPQKRKRHEKPMPVLGGLAFIITISSNVLMYVNFELSPFVFALIGAFGIFAIGIYDDKKTLSPWVKIALQVVLISMLFVNGVKIEYVNMPFNKFPIFFNDWLAYFITLIWMLTIINMFNIIDGIDGLSTGVSFLTSLALFFVSLSVSPPVISYLLCIIIGASAMFLKFNFYPAKIFLGDSGALLLGYLFGVISILGVLKSTVSVVALAFIFAIPIIDICLSIMRRLLKRKNIFNPDLEHIHHQLVRRGISVPKAVIILYIISGVFCLFGILNASNITIVRSMIGLILFIAVLIYFMNLQMSNKRFKSSKN